MAKISLFIEKTNSQYYDISVKLIENPILYLARTLVGNNTLGFVGEPDVLLPEVQVDPAKMQQYNLEFEKAAENPLPEDNENDDL